MLIFQTQNQKLFIQRAQSNHLNIVNHENYMKKTYKKAALLKIKKLKKRES